MDEEQVPDAAPGGDPARRRFLHAAGLIGVAGAGGAMAGYLASSASDDVGSVPAAARSGTDRTPVLAPSVDGAENALTINRAIAQAARGSSVGRDLPDGGLVVLTGGAFPVTEPIVLRPGVVLAGMGWGTQVQRRFDGGPLVTFQARSGSVPGAYAAEVRDLYLVGQRAKYPSSENHGVLLDATNPKGEGWADPNCRVNGLRVAYCAGHGIVVARHPGSGSTSSRACLLTGNFVLACGGDGFNLNGSDATVSECYSGGNDGAGFAVAAGNVTVSASKASYNNGSGFAVTGQRAVLAACQAQDNQPDGFVLTTTSGTSVSGCQGDTNQLANFRLDGVSASSLNGLLSVYRPGGRYQAMPRDGGIVIQGDSSGCQLSGCSPEAAGGVSGSLPDGGTSQIVTP